MQVFRLFFLIITIIIFPSPVSAAQNGVEFKSDLTYSSRALLRLYASCLVKSVNRLEPSGASFDDLWKGAITDCAGEWADALEKIEADFAIKDPEHAGPRALMMLDGGMEPTRDESRLNVLTTRAARLK